MKDEQDKGFERLWAPWRMKYIAGIDTAPKGECVFCDKPAEDDDDKNFIVHRGENCFIVLNIFPYNNGHTLIIPYKHTAELAELDSETKLELFDLAGMLMEIMKTNMKTDGFNMGANFGRSAGAGIAEHFHLHIVPRWNGDTNFMPVVGSTKGISESLEDTYRKLKKGIEDYISGK
jgi:ATP adenylyltransferase